MKEHKVNSTESLEPYNKIINGYHKDETIEVDGTYFHHATLDHCVIKYGGGEVTWTTDIKIINCTFRFHDSAQRMMKFLTGFKTKNTISGETNLEDIPVINDHKN